MLAVLLTDVVYGADVRVIQSGCRVRFTAEALEGDGVVEHFGRQEFQTPGAAEPVFSAL